MSEWSEFNFDIPKDPHRGWEHLKCEEFEEVFHVTHVDTAIRILKDGKIRCGLIGDESKLKKKRIAVTWLSPNTWRDGSMYGNVGFSFKFDPAIEGINYYWVEVMKKYTPIAVRFLITTKTYSYLTPYDPTADDGPWKVSPEGRHYRKKNINIEFMFEDDLPISKCRYIRQFKHHDKYCNILKSDCAERGKSELKAGKEFYSSIIAHNVPIVPRHFRESEKGRFIPRHYFYQGMGPLFSGAEKKKEVMSGKITYASPASDSLVRASLNALATGNTKDYEEILGLFSSYKDYEQKLEEIIIDYFKVDAIDYE